jgi:uncharacterized protein involved in response to NO
MTGITTACIHIQLLTVIGGIIICFMMKRSISTLNSLTRKRRHNYISNTIITTLCFLETVIKSTSPSTLRFPILGVEITKYIKIKTLDT